MKARLYNGRAVLALFGIIATIILFAQPALPVFAQEVTSVGVYAPAQVEIGAQVAVSVEVHNVENLFGYEMTLHFDLALLSVDDAEPSNPGVQVQMGPFLAEGVVFFNTVDLTEGTAQVVVVLFNPSEPVSGSGTLFTVLFRGLKDGISPLTFSDLTLTDRDGNVIMADVISSQVTVGAGEVFRLFLPLIGQSEQGLTTLPGGDFSSRLGEKAVFGRMRASAGSKSRAERINI